MAMCCPRGWARCIDGCVALNQLCCWFFPWCWNPTNLLEPNQDLPSEGEWFRSRYWRTAGEGKLFFSAGTSCRRLARRRHLLGPSIRCGAVVPARQLSKYYNLMAGHLVQDEKNSSTEPRAEPLPTRHLCLTSWICPSNSSLSRGWYSMGFCLKIWWIWRRMLTEWKIFCSTQY